MTSERATTGARFKLEGKRFAGATDRMVRRLYCSVALAECARDGLFVNGVS